MPDNKAIMLNFLTYSILPILKPDGVWAAPNPAPLTAEEVIPIFELVAANPRYQRQHLTTATEDDQLVHLQNGVVHSEPVEGTPWEDSPKIFHREE